MRMTLAHSIDPPVSSFRTEIVQTALRGQVYRE